MDGIRRALEEDRRIVLLRSLDDASTREANQNILASCLAEYGHHCTDDQVLTLLDWLAEQGLVTLRYVGRYAIAQLTRRGLEVATGRARVSGVGRPKPMDGEGG